MLHKPLVDADGTSYFFIVTKACSHLCRSLTCCILEDRMCQRYVAAFMRYYERRCLK